MRFLPRLVNRDTPPGATEQRSLGWPDYTRPPSWNEISMGGGYSPIPVTTESAYGLPAVGAAIRLVAETLAALPFSVYSGEDADKRKETRSWQHTLLHDMPGMGDFTAYDFVADVAGGLEASGNAYVQKVKAGGRVIALIVIDPGRVEIKRENGEKLFLIVGKDGRQERHTQGEILHVRGFTMNGDDTGLSPIGVHRRKLGAVMARDEFEGRFFGQGTNTGGAIEFPAGAKVSPDEQKTFLRRWINNHSGLANSHLPILLTDGAKYTRMGMNLVDAQYVESEKLNLVQVANIFRLPPSWLGAEMPRNTTAEQETLKLYMALLPRIKRIEMAFRNDPDLFPDRNLYPEFETQELIRTDAKTAAEVEHLQIQDGSLLRDEARAKRGQAPLPPIPDDPSQAPGSVPLLTPTGAGANPQMGPQPAPSNEPVPAQGQ